MRGTGAPEKSVVQKVEKETPLRTGKTFVGSFLVSLSLFFFLVAHVCAVLSCNVMGKAEISVESFVLLCANEKCLPSCECVPCSRVV